MADLSQYVDFTVKIDNSGSTPKISVTDISSYPSGASAFQGFVQVTQPDGISVGPESTPDITDALRAADKPYRYASDGSLQNGTYTIQYVVKCTGYDDTVVTRQFTLGYVRPTLNLAPSIDAFTPKILVRDNTDYSQNSLITLDVSRVWQGQIYNVNSEMKSLSGSDQTLDFVYNGNYYDSLYYSELKSIINYNLISAPFVYVSELLSNQVQFDVYAPKSIAEYSAAIQIFIENNKSCCGKKETESVIRAQQLLSQVLLYGKQGDTIGLDIYTNKLDSILFPSEKLSHTGKAIPSYIFSDSPSVPLVTLPLDVVAKYSIGGIAEGMSLSNWNILDAFIALIGGDASGGGALEWHGWNATGIPPVDPSILQHSGSYLLNGDATVNFIGNVSSNNYLIFVTLLSQIKFTSYVASGFTAPIDSSPSGGNLFYYIEQNGYRYYITNYPTIMGEVTFKK